MRNNLHKEAFVRHICLKRAVMAIIVALVAMMVSAPVLAATLGELTGDGVNVRASAEICDSNILFKVQYGDIVEVIKVAGDFYQVNVGDTCDVFIARQFVSVILAEGTSIIDDVYIYPSPDTEAFAPIGILEGGSAVTARFSVEGWYCIALGEGIGYIKKNEAYIPLAAELQKKQMKSGNIYNTNNAKADDVIEYAKKFIGTKYLYGSMNPEKGFDCSGFVSYVMKNFDISLNRSSSAMASNGLAVKRSELKKGDLMFFNTSGKSGTISHVGIYIGDGEFIHSSSGSRKGVVISSLDEKYYDTRFVKATRVL